MGTGSMEGSRRARAAARASVGSAWVEVKRQKHWCFPPRWYPQPERGEPQLGPLSRWECPSCSLIWTSFGIFIDNDREDWPRADLSTRPLFGVERWRVIDKEGQLPRNQFHDQKTWQDAMDHVKLQEDNYDWRGIALLSNKFLRQLVELNGGDWRNVLD